MSVPLFTGRLVELAGPEFRADLLGQEFVRVEAGVDAVSGLLDWAALDELLTTRMLDAPQLRLYRGGSQVPLDRYTRGAEEAGGRRVVQPEHLYRELREGASLILDGVDRLHPPVTAAADDLMRLVRELVQVNLYLVWGGGQGFNTHWDDHETVVVQLAGTKRWTVHGPGRPYPMKRDVDVDHEAPDTVVWDGVLHAGDIIHVPRGWWHTVRGNDELSMHLTFGFTRRTGVDWARWLSERLHEHELFRQDLPRFAPSERRAEHHARLVETLSSLVATHPPEDFLETRDRAFPRRSEVNLPWAVAYERPAGDARLVLTSLIPPTLTPRESSVDLVVAGSTYRFAPAMGPLLEVLVAERSVTVAELHARAELADTVFDAALELLLRQHLVVVRPAPVPVDARGW